MAKRTYTFVVKPKTSKASKIARTSGVNRTPQTHPIPGRAMVKNNAGGYAFKADSWLRLDRFLIIGSEGGSYYVTERKLTTDNAENVLACIAEDGVRVVNRVTEMVQNRRVPKMDTALFVLGLCMKHDNANRQTREAANRALTDVCKIGTHVFDLAGVIKELGGWGRGTVRAFQRWYNEQAPRNLAYQVTKYQQRNGFSQRDMLRLVHPKPASEQHKEIFQWITGKLPYDMDKWLEAGGSNGDPEAAWFRPIEGFERAKRATTEKEIVKLIEEYDLVREAIPTQWLNSLAVWEAMLQKMPYTATLRNLGKMSEIGLLAPLSAASKLVVNRLTDREQIVKARVHPIALLNALYTYGQGHGIRSSKSWTVVPQVKDALDTAFNLSFAAVEPTGLNFMLGIDVSGSMGGFWGGFGLAPGITPCMAASAMAMVTARTEQNYFIGGFSHVFKDLKITAKDTIESAMRKAQDSNFGGTDAAKPIQFAMKNKMHVDAFVNYSDGESWAGDQHACQALREYRNKVNPNAHMIYVNFVANRHTLNDPSDPNALDIVGFDTGAPDVMRSFLLGEF